MEMTDVKNNLRKVAKEIENDDPMLAEEILDASDEAEDLEEKSELWDHMPENVIGIHGPNTVTSAEKKASLLNEGDFCTCCNPAQGIFKGYKYLVGPTIEPGLVIISDVDGKKIGLFNINRFLPDTNAF
jgi:hypothetical protein